jgi:hypothetical protein
MPMTDWPTSTEPAPTGPLERFGWLTLGVIVTASTLVLGSLLARDWLDSTGPAPVDLQRQSYSEPINRIELDLGDADATILAGPGGGVEVERHLRGKDKPTVEETWRGSTFHVRVRCAPGGVIHFGRRCAAAYVIRIPVDTVVDARTGSGDLNVRDIAGDLHLTTGSGDIALANTSGAVWARADSGAITGGKLSSPELSAQLGSGDARLAFAAAPRSVTAAATSGDVNIAVPEGRYRTSAHSDTGDQTVSVYGDDAATSEITARTGSGDVNIHYGGD